MEFLKTLYSVSMDTSQSVYDMFEKCQACLDNFAWITCWEWAKLLCYECDQANHQSDPMLTHRRDVIQIQDFWSSQKTSLDYSDDQVLYQKENKGTEGSYYEYSTHLKTDHQDRSELSEINIANEVNKSNEQKALKSFTDNSFSKENRPTVYEYQNQQVKNIKQMQGIRKSAEFTFSNFKDIKDEDLDDGFVTMSEQPYFSNRVHISSASGVKNSLEDKSEYAKYRYANTNTKYPKQSPMTSQRGRPRTQMAHIKQARLKSELKEEYEKLRSLALDQESARIKSEHTYKQTMSQYREKEKNLESILSQLKSKTKSLEQLNQKKINEMCK